MIKRFSERIERCKEIWNEVEKEASTVGYSGRQYLYLEKKLLELLKYNRIGIYGTGSHTSKLLSFMKKLEMDNKICCIVDEKKEESVFLQFPLHNNLPEAIKEYNLDAIIISSLTFENDIFLRIRNKVPLEVDLVKLYDQYEVDAEERVYMDNDEEWNIKELPYMWKAYQAHVNRYYFALAYVDGKKVLDVACGSGYGSAILAQRAKSVVGGDLSEEAIQFAQKHYSLENVVFIQESIEKIRLEQTVDVLISFETIEHIADEKGYFECVDKNLSKNGIFIVSTPIADKDGQSDSNMYHVNEYTKERFKKTLENQFREVVYYRQEYYMGGAICVDDGTFKSENGDNAYAIAVCYK